MPKKETIQTVVSRVLKVTLVSTFGASVLIPDSPGLFAEQLPQLSSPEDVPPAHSSTPPGLPCPDGSEPRCKFVLGTDLPDGTSTPSSVNCECPNPTPEATPEPTPEPTPARVCDYTFLRLDPQWMQHRARNGKRTLPWWFYEEKSADVPDCLGNIVEQTSRQCEQQYKLSPSNPLIAGCMKQKIVCQRLTTRGGAFIKYADRYGSCLFKDDNTRDGVSVYLDSGCNVVPSKQVPKEAEICKAELQTITYNNSPISFLWDASGTLENNFAIVEFPLTIDPRASWTGWYASDKTPLLVFDPEQSGGVTSAAQLFGEWTFGGQGFASLSAGLNPTPWEHGYQALATLDANGDRKLTGTELRSLALWFDANQNGKSDAGEVKSLKELGVSVVYVDPSRRDAKTNHLWADLGFERVTTDGTTVHGKSVDWYAMSGASKHELVSRYLASQAQPVDRPLHDLEPPVAAQPQSKLLAPGLSFTGVWAWSADANPELGNAKGGSGYLLLEEYEDGSLQGISLVQTALEADQVKLTLQQVPLIGKVKGVLGGVREGEFRLRTANGQGATSKVSFHPVDGRVVGKTTGSIRMGETVLPLDYDWTANPVR